MTAVVMKWIRNPYMVSRWATRRRALQNSPDARKSTRPVLMAIDANSPPPIAFDPLVFDFRQIIKKILRAPLVHDVEQRPRRDQDDHDDDIGLHDGRRYGRRELGK